MATHPSLTTLFFALTSVAALGCGDNISLEETEAASRIVCDSSDSCDERLEKSLTQWSDLAAEDSGEYSYISSQTFADGSRTETQIRVESGIVVERNTRGTTRGTLAPFQWTETGDAIGTHSVGAPVANVSTLYELCVIDVLRLGVGDHHIELQFFESGLLSSCTGAPRDCQTDCLVGPRIDSISVLLE